MARKFARVETERLDEVATELNVLWTRYSMAAEGLTYDEWREWQVYSRLPENEDGAATAAAWQAYQAATEVLFLLGIRWDRYENKHEVWAVK